MKRRFIYFAGDKATVKRCTYINNGRLAIVLEWKDLEGFNSTISKNLEDGLELGDEYAYLDTNNYTGIDDILLQSGLAVPTGMYCRSGYYRYPLFKFDLSKIPEVKE